MPDQLTRDVLLAHAAATWFMTGLIWFVQIVHYPLMGAVPGEGFPAYAKAHQRLTTWIVGPVMLIELAAAAMLAMGVNVGPDGRSLRWLGLAILVVIWVSTFAVQVPLHERLAKGLDRRVWRWLVVTNWARTVAWTARGVIALVMMR